MAAGQSGNRRKGQELIEFALVTSLFSVMFLGAFVTGMSLIRAIQVQQTCRDLTAMYIHGADFSTYSMQQVAGRLAHGLNMQIGTSFTGNNASNVYNSGNVLVTVSTLMYVGTTSQPNCTSVGAGKCTNHDSFVFVQRIKFGNGSLAAQKPSSFGDPSTTAMSATGILQNPVTDGGAKLSGSAQSSTQALWKTMLQDGQMVYVVELYVQSPDLNFGKFSGGGVYARYFF
jgi:hypothetical protein